MEQLDGCPTPETVTRAQLDGKVREWRALKAKRLSMQKEVDAVEELEKEAKEFIMEAIQLQQFEGIVADGRVTALTTKDIPVCDNPSATWEYIFEHKATDLVSFKLSTKAAELRMADGITIPGVSTIEKHDLSDKKA